MQIGIGCRCNLTVGGNCSHNCHGRNWDRSNHHGERAGFYAGVLCGLAALLAFLRHGLCCGPGDCRDHDHDPGDDQTIHAIEKTSGSELSKLVKLKKDRGTILARKPRSRVCKAAEVVTCCEVRLVLKAGALKQLVCKSKIRLSCQRCYTDFDKT